MFVILVRSDRVPDEPLPSFNLRSCGPPNVHFGGFGDVYLYTSFKAGVYGNETGVPADALQGNYKVSAEDADTPEYEWAKPIESGRNVGFVITPRLWEEVSWQLASLKHIHGNPHLQIYNRMARGLMTQYELATSDEPWASAKLKAELARVKDGFRCHSVERWYSREQFTLCPNAFNSSNPCGVELLIPHTSSALLALAEWHTDLVRSVWPTSRPFPEPRFKVVPELDFEFERRTLWEDGALMRHVLCRTYVCRAYVNHLCGRSGREQAIVKESSCVLEAVMLDVSQVSLGNRPKIVSQQLDHFSGAMRDLHRHEDQEVVDQVVQAMVKARGHAQAAYVQGKTRAEQLNEEGLDIQSRVRAIKHRVSRAMGRGSKSGGLSGEEVNEAARELKALEDASDANLVASELFCAEAAPSSDAQRAHIRHLKNRAKLARMQAAERQAKEAELQAKEAERQAVLDAASAARVAKAAAWQAVVNTQAKQDAFMTIHDVLGKVWDRRSYHEERARAGRSRRLAREYEIIRQERHDQLMWEANAPQREAEARRRALATKVREDNAREGTSSLPSHGASTVGNHGKKAGIPRVAQLDDQGMRDHADYTTRDARLTRKLDHMQEQVRKAALADELALTKQKQVQREQEIKAGKKEARRQARHPASALRLGAFVGEKATPLATLADWKPSSTPRPSDDDDGRSVVSVATTAVQLPPPTRHAVERASERELSRRELQWAIKNGPVEHTGWGADGQPTLVHRGRSGGADVVTDANCEVVITAWPAKGGQGKGKGKGRGQGKERVSR